MIGRNRSITVPRAPEVTNQQGFFDRVQIPALLALFLSAAVLYGADGNRLRSADLQNGEDKIGTLKKYLKLRSAVRAAEFDIYDVNLDAASSIPGPTHRDYRMALVLDKKDAKKWLSDVAVTSFPKDISWCRALMAGKPGFELRHPQEFWTYTGKDRVIFYFEKDGVLCLRISQG